MKTPTVKDDFEYMRNMIEKVKMIEHRSKALPMDLSAVSEIHDHTDYVKWCDEGSPADSWDNNGEWTEDCSQYMEKKETDSNSPPSRQQLPILMLSKERAKARARARRAKEKARASLAKEAVTMP